MSAPSPAAPQSAALQPAAETRIRWATVVTAAAVMLATLPGRTQGLGLITEGLIADLGLTRIAFGELNLWATLIGAAACLPMGWLIDRYGLRWPTVVVVLLLAAAVAALSRLAAGVMPLFLLIFATRAFGQSALSVASITAVGRLGGPQAGWAMGVYTVLLTVFMAAAFVGVGELVAAHGWRVAWIAVAAMLALGIAPWVALGFPASRPGATVAVGTPSPAAGHTLRQALGTTGFWVFAGATALFGLAASGLSLWNQQVLAEHGFDQRTNGYFLAITTLFALFGQFACGWLLPRVAPPRLLAGALFAYAAGLGVLALTTGPAMLWTAAFCIGLAAGFIMVLFFAIWGLAFGPRQLGRIQGAAQALTVLASAVGPLIFAHVHAANGSFTPALAALALGVAVAGAIAWRTRLPTARFNAGAYARRQWPVPAPRVRTRAGECARPGDGQHSRR